MRGCRLKKIKVMLFLRGKYERSGEVAMRSRRPRRRILRRGMVGDGEEKRSGQAFCTILGCPLRISLYSGVEEESSRFRRQGEGRARHQDGARVLQCEGQRGGEGRGVGGVREEAGRKMVAVCSNIRVQPHVVQCLNHRHRAKHTTS